MRQKQRTTYRTGETKGRKKTERHEATQTEVKARRKTKDRKAESIGKRLEKAEVREMRETCRNT